LDKANARPLAAGGIAIIPPKSNHFARTGAEGDRPTPWVGPWGVTYVNPAEIRASSDKPSILPGCAGRLSRAERPPGVTAAADHPGNRV
jgi:hypothetical protein